MHFWLWDLNYFFYFNGRNFFPTMYLKHFYFKKWKETSSYCSSSELLPSCSVSFFFALCSSFKGWKRKPKLENPVQHLLKKSYSSKLSFKRTCINHVFDYHFYISQTNMCLFIWYRKMAYFRLNIIYFGIRKQEICKKVRAQQWTEYCSICLVTCYYPGDCSSYLAQPPFNKHIILFQHQTECKKKLKHNLCVIWVINRKHC